MANISRSLIGMALRLSGRVIKVLHNDFGNALGMLHMKVMASAAAVAILPVGQGRQPFAVSGRIKDAAGRVGAYGNGGCFDVLQKIEDLFFAVAVAAGPGQAHIMAPAPTFRLTDQAALGQQLGAGLIKITCLAAYWHRRDRKSTRLNSSHVAISYAAFCLKKKTTTKYEYTDQQRPYLR